MRKLILSALIVLVIAEYVCAAGREYNYREYPWQMRSVAALGMGDAYMVKSFDKFAPFYNPAGLAYVKEGKVDIFSVGVCLKDNTNDFYNKMRTIGSKENSTVAKYLANQIREKHSIYANIYPSYTRHNFTIGVFGTTQIKIMTGNPVMPELDVNATADYGMVGGVSKSFLNDVLHIGISGRVQKRYSHVHTYTLNELVSGKLDKIRAGDLDESIGAFLDFGLIYELYKKGFNPKFGFVINNLGTNAMGKAKDLPYSVNISAGISPLREGVIALDVVLDIRDITNNFDEDYDWGKRINLGAEVRFYNIVALRGGLHQGYLAYGFGLDLHYLKLDYAYYQEEMGAYAGSDVDKRHALELSIGF